MNDITNADRAERARTALEAYGPKDDPEAMISDLMTDLLHLAASEGFDTERQLRLARMNFIAEQDEEAEDTETFEDTNESGYNQDSSNPGIHAYARYLAQKSGLDA